jgi:GxxExxY protein
MNASNTQAEQPDAKGAKVAQKTQKIQDDFELTREDELSRLIIGCAVEVQRELGPGLLESVYRKALMHELRANGLTVEAEVEFNAFYKGENVGLAYRSDLIVNDLVVIELKSVEALLEIHRAQLLTYLHLTGHRLGLLINFGEFPVTKGIKRMVNKL